MAQQETAEVLLISAMLNVGDVDAPRTFGLTPDHIQGFSPEYNWLVNYPKIYDCQPSKDAFKQAFPEFRLAEHEDVRSAVDAVFRAFGRRAMTAAMTSAYDMLQIDDLELAWTELAKAEPMRTSPRPKKTLTDLEFLDDWEAPLSAVEYPYPTLQRHTGGIQPGNLVYLAARPGQGKTAHLCNIVKHAVKCGNRVRFFSLEMSEAEVRARFHAAWAYEMGYTNIDLNAIRARNVDRHEYKTFVQELDDKIEGYGGCMDLFTPRNGPCTPGRVANGADEYHLTVVDYVGLMHTDGGAQAVDDWRLAAKISNSLKETSLASSTGLLVASQINREGETGKNPPKVANLAQSDALGQDGDVVVTMRSKEFNVATALSLEKNRHGASGIGFFTTFDPNHGVYREITKEAAENLVLDQEMGL